MAARSLFVLLVVFGLVAGADVVRAEPPPPARSGVARQASRDLQDGFARRPVAVIDITNDQAVRDVANRLLELLAAHAELAPPAISDAAALVDRPPADDEIRIAEAQRKRLSAEQNLIQRNFREAAIDASEGQELLLHVTPHVAINLYADLALALGQARLGEKRDDDAREAFALTYRLDPHRALDELHYLPEVVQAFEAAKRQDAGTGTIAVRGAGKVWVDGEERGSAPGEFPVSLGRHVVWLTGLLRETAGKEVRVAHSRPGDATIMDGPLTRPQKVVRFRNALTQAQDPAARAAAMAALAAFVNVHDAVLLSTINGRIVWQTWRDRAPGFSAPHEMREPRRDGPLEILRELAPPRPIVEPELPLLPPPLPPETRWYRRPGVQIGIAVALVAGLIGGYLWAHYTEPDRAWNSDISGFGVGSR